MSDPLSWSINLGRWAGVQVRAHFLLVLFASLSVLQAAISEEAAVLPTLGWLALLVLALALHELGHLGVAVAREVEPEDVNLWPLGNLLSPIQSSTYSSRGADAAIVALAGPLVNGAVAIAISLGMSMFTDARMVLNPFGNPDGGGAPPMADGVGYAAPFSVAWILGWFGYINWVLFLANLIPALPLDGGRALRSLVDPAWSPGSRDGLIGPWTARVSAIVLVLVGVIRILMGSYGGVALLGLALLVYMFARIESRMFDEGGFLDDGLFGYDFSQGYTSLEAGPATVRPRREGVLRRWRRRREEQRRRRSEARVAADELRMDQILDKIHREGRDSLSPAENRFLVRVSAKYKSRTRSRD